MGVSIVSEHKCSHFYMQKRYANGPTKSGPGNVARTARVFENFPENLRHVARTA
jgi:hypothetical protein